MVMAATSHAAIISSGLRDIVITTDFTGIYLDIDGGGTVAEEAPGWDFNAFFGGEGIADSANFHPVTATVILDAPVLDLTAGQTVGGSSIFASTYTGGFSGSSDHVGNGVGQFASGSEGYIGFKFTTNSSAGPFYGWLRVMFSNTGSTGLIRDWAYENTGAAIAVAAVPEPTVLYSLVLGAVVFCYRRKR